jgi:hypothetical protein
MRGALFSKGLLNWCQQAQQQQLIEGSPIEHSVCRLGRACLSLVAICFTQCSSSSSHAQPALPVEAGSSAAMSTAMP